jgi:hypothetical protein
LPIHLQGSARHLDCFIPQGLPIKISSDRLMEGYQLGMMALILPPRPQVRLGAKAP